MNTYAEVQSLQKSPIDIGSLCQIFYFKIEDVQDWPSVDPLTNIISNAIVFKAGKGMFLCQAIEKGKSYEAETADSAAGPFTSITVSSTLGGNNTANISTLDVMKHHQWGLIVKDRGGYMRLVGSQDAGAKFSYKETSGDHPTASRKVDLKWQWEYPTNAPIYQSATFTITIGPVTFTTGKLEFILSFQAGAPGAPMAAGDTLLTRAAFAGRKLLVLVDGIALPCDDGSGSIDWPSLIIRHYEKTLAGDTINYVGGVVNGEIHVIYAFD